MSFFDEARHARSSYVAAQNNEAEQGVQAAKQFIASELGGNQDNMYRELRRVALEKFRSRGEIEEISYEQQWTLNWEVKHCDTTVVKNHLEMQAKEAFARLSAEIGGKERLVEYRRGGMPPYGGTTHGLEIRAEHQDYYDDEEAYDSYRRPYRFSIFIRAHYTPPLTG